MSSTLESTRPPEATAVQPGRRLPSLTGMRFVCAALVFATQSTVMAFFASQDTSTKWFAAATQGGYTGVVYFFILSGFVLTWSWRTGDRAGGFWGRRIARIYPAYLVVLAVSILLVVTVHGTPFDRKFDGRLTVLDVFLLNSWLPAIADRANYNPATWSLSVEALFYLAFPLLIALVGKVRPERLWAWAGGVVAAIFAIPALVVLLPQGESYPDFATTATQVWVDQQLPATRLLEFVLGILMARIVISRRRLPVGLGGAVALTAFAYWLATYVPTRFDMAAIMVIPLALVVAAGAAQDIAGRPSFIAGRVWVRLGEISYAFYLVQWPVLLYGKHFLVGEKPLGSVAGFGLLILLFVISLAIAWVLHVAVERPFLRRFSRRGATERQAAERADAVEPAEPPAAPAEAAVRRVA